MKENFVHVCFVVDESGSMWSSNSDVLGGFKRVIDEQRAVKDGTCSVSLFKFASTVEEVYRGVDVNSIGYLDEKSYHPGGCTAMNDGIGTAIDSIGAWLSEMPEEERPEKNLIVIMTDGEENASREYSLDKIKGMIKEQEEKYSWTFVYLGTDVSALTIENARSIGLSNLACSIRSNYSEQYDTVNSVISSYRSCVGSSEVKAAALDKSLHESLGSLNAKYKSDTGIDVDNA